MDSNLITAVGIDVSKGKSTVAIRRPGGEIVRKPFTVKHDRGNDPGENGAAAFNILRSIVTVTAVKPVP